MRRHTELGGVGRQTFKFNQAVIFFCLDIFQIEGGGWPQTWQRTPSLGRAVVACKLSTCKHHWCTVVNAMPKKGVFLGSLTAK